jgi:hypothetical protein
MACEDLVVGCFLDDRVPLAVPELNRECALMYPALEALTLRATLSHRGGSRPRFSRPRREFVIFRFGNGPNNVRPLAH